MRSQISMPSPLTNHPNVSNASLIFDFAGGDGRLPESLPGVKVNLIANAILVIVIPIAVISEAIVTPSFLNNSEIRTLSGMLSSLTSKRLSFIRSN